MKYNFTKLRRARLDKGWTQDKLAMRSGVSREAISLVENGQKQWEKAILKMQKALGVRVIQTNGGR